MDDLAPCPRAAEQMAAFDALPPEYRRFLAYYPRACKATDAALILRVCHRRVDDAIAEIRAHLPIRRQS